MKDIMIVRTNYPGGNVKVLEIDKNHIKLKQELRDTGQWWFYWNFCVKNPLDKEVVFEFVNGDVIGPWGPAISYNGYDWNWLGEESLINRASFRYRFKKDIGEVYFCFSIPYQVKDYEGFVKKYTHCKLLKRDVLTVSEQGKDIPIIKIGNSSAEWDIVFTCRNHACKSTASYLLEGIMDYFLRNRELTVVKDYLIHIIPFMDIDGVENGDQGKGRVPHDHNRDYIEKPIYRSTMAFMEYVKKLKPVVAIDFHSPNKWGNRNNFPFFCKRQSPIKEEIERMGMLLEEYVSKNPDPGKINYSREHDIEFGQGWNDGKANTCTKFCLTRGVRFACTFEFPYFGVKGGQFTQQNMRNFGRDFAKALEKYLE